MLTKNRLTHLFILLSGMLICGCVAVSIGKELNWDLASYHLYNPLAFLQHRATLDVWPMEFVHVHLTPTADFLTFFFITYLQPKTAVFALGALHGINVWLLYVIASEALLMLPKVTFPRAWACLLAVMGMYAPLVIPGIGSFQHDALVSLFILGSVVLMLKSQSQKYLIASGFLLGVAAGLKLTAGIFVLATLLATMLMRGAWSQRTSRVMFIGVGVTVGVLLTSGYWMWIQWQQYHSPLFPFMNSIFHSPYFPATSWSDPRFLPQTWMETLFYPFYFSFDGRTNDVPFRDFRFAILYVLLALSLFVKRDPLPPMIKWLISFFVIAYIIWQLGFSIMRYAMPLEMLAPLIIFLMLYVLMKDMLIRSGCMIVISLFLVQSMYPAQAVRTPNYAGSYFNVALPTAAQHSSRAMVFMPVSAYALAMKPRPQTYLISALPSKWQYVGVPFKGQNFRLSARMATALKSFHGRIFLLSSSDYERAMRDALSQLWLIADGPCAAITSDRQKISDEAIQLCPLKKINNAYDNDFIRVSVEGLV